MDLIDKSKVINITAETGALETQSRVRDMQVVISIPDNATNGDVLTTLFPLQHTIGFAKDVVYLAYDRSWWETQYKVGDIDG